MTERRDSDAEPAGPAPDLEPAEELGRDRPLPSAAFRGALGRHLAALDPGYRPRPTRLRLAVSALVGTGTALLVLGALQATGGL